MQDVSELERRIASALDRIGEGLDAVAVEPMLASAEADGVSASELQAELDAERQVTAQLEERLRTLKDRQVSEATKSEQQLEQARQIIETLEQDRGRLKKVTEALRNSNQALREANAEGIGDAHLINAALQTEIDALRVSRESDRAEMDGVLGALAPVLQGEAANA